MRRVPARIFCVLLAVCDALVDCQAGDSDRFCKSEPNSCHGRWYSLTKPCGPPDACLDLPEKGPIMGLQAVDLDADGQVDLLVSHVGGRASVVKHDEGLVEGNSTIGGMKFPYGSFVQAVDWDHDGDLDLVAVDSTGLWPSMLPWNATMLFYWENVDGGFYSRTGLDNPFHATRVSELCRTLCFPHFVDWDGDSFLDLILSARGKDDLLLFFHRSPTGSLTQLEGAPNPLAGFGSTGSLGAAAVQAIDWDGDGDLDLVVAHSSNTNLQVYERMEDWSMERVAQISFHSKLSKFALARLGQGLPALFQASQGSTRVCVRRPQAEEAFQPRSPAANPFFDIKVDTRAFPNAVDWDGDGFLDVVMLNRDGTLSFWQGASGGFLPRTGDNPLQDVTGGAHFVEVVDWDSDGDMDVLAVSGWPSTRVELWEQLANGSLMRQTGDKSPFTSIDMDSGIGDAPTPTICEVHSADWDSDGDMDLIGFVRSSGKAAEIWYWENAGGSLHLRSGDSNPFGGIRVPGPAAARMQVLDYDGDGNLDFFLSEYATGRLHLWLDHGGELHELNNSRGGSSPFPPVADISHRTSVVQLVPWQGEWSLLAGGLDGTLSFFQKGFCEVTARCSSSGSCKPSGECNCNQDRRFSDCSGCAAGYSKRFTGFSSCQPCAGVEAGEGACYKRGICVDDVFVSANAPLVLEQHLARGNASCNCNEHFFGTSDGLNTCLEGMCPVGFELKPIMPNRAGSLNSNLNRSLLSCQKCDPGYGKAASGNEPCQRCQVNFVSPPKGKGVCERCAAGYTSDPERKTCRVKASTIYGAVVLFLCSLLGCLVFPVMLGLPIAVEDVRFERGAGTVVTTASVHCLLPCLRWLPEVCFFGTGVPMLDGKAFRVQSLGFRRLLLHDKEHLKALAETCYDTNKGFLRFSPQFALYWTGLGIPFWLWLLASMVISAIVCVFCELPASEIISVVCAAILCAALAHLRIYWSNSRSALALSRHRFRQRLRERNPWPSACQRGPHRAITAAQLHDFFQYFVAYLGERSMYYVAQNLIIPLTQPTRLSYAELAGPSEVQWFVSHFWGTPFKHFVDCVRKHSESLATGAWEDLCYWICSFSNNQWRVGEELGGSDGWVASSFYLALRGGSCQGTAMIFDDEALPLERSWCLFELLQTLQLSQEDASFRGLFLCVPSGVLASGSCSLDAALAISRKLATLDLQKARASCQEDKEMIDALVVQSGGFAEVNDFVKRHVREVLQATQQRFSCDLGLLESGLALPVAPAEPQASQAQVRAETSEHSADSEDLAAAPKPASRGCVVA